MNVKTLKELMQFDVNEQTDMTMKYIQWKYVHNPG